MPETSRQQIVVITPDVLRGRMAGPAIRATNIAAALAAEHDVTLISTAACEIERPGFRCRFVPWHGLRRAVADAPVVIFQGFVSYHAPWLLRSDKILVVDLYDPVHLEQLVQLADRPLLERRATNDLSVRVINEQLVRGDFFLCASDQQRHLWLGQLAAMGRLNPATYDRDPRLASLIAVCPFGLPSQPPSRTAPAIRGVVDGVGADDAIVLWAGGVYDWFDPLTLIRAVDKVRHSYPSIRLYFLGMAHPNPEVPRMSMTVRTRELADELGLTDRSVFFNDGWVAYDERANYLLDANVGASTHFDHLETVFSFRTRMLDYLWAGLPIVCTAGDSFGDLVRNEGLGVAVPEADVDALADALITTLYDADFAAAARAAVAGVRERFTWDRALQPLLEFCRNPRRAADVGEDQRRLARRPVPPPSAIGRDAARAVALVREGGLGLMVNRVRGRARRLRREHRDERPG